MSNSRIPSEKAISEPHSPEPEISEFCRPTEEGLLNPTRSKNNSTELFVDGPAVLAMLLREIEKARHFIHVQVMLFYSDEAGFKIAHALAKKAEEGVQVRVMSDSEMSFLVRLFEKFRSGGSSNFSEIKAIFSRSGVKFVSSEEESYVFRDWNRKRDELQKRGVSEEFLEMQDLVQEEVKFNFNTFDHRKLLVFDGETAVVMGSNIGNKYLYNTSPSEGSDNTMNWHDGALLIRGPFASVANKHFASKWTVRGGDVFDYQEHFRSKEKYGRDICTAYSHFPGLKENCITGWYFRKLKTCEDRFIIENPYINDEDFWDLLANLSEEQAKKITLINPYKAKGNDYPQNESCIRCRMYDPFKKGVSFYAYQQRMTHWKIALDVAASEVFVGSYNLNHRSALHDFEMNVLVESEILAKRVGEMLEQDMKESVELTDISEFHRYPKLHSSCLLLDITEFFE